MHLKWRDENSTTTKSLIVLSKADTRHLGQSESDISFPNAVEVVQKDHFHVTDSKKTTVRKEHQHMRNNVLMAVSCTGS